MRKILAITVALMIAAIVIMPALGYTNQAAGNQSYSAKSGSPVEYSLKTINVPAHNLTPDMVVNKYSFKSAGVASTRMAYSFQSGAVAPYSFKLVGVENAVAQGMKTVKPTAKLGSMVGSINDESASGPAGEVAEKPAPTAEAVPAAAPAAEPAATPEPEAAAPTTFSIEGMVVDNNQTGLAEWTINLTKDGAVINSVPTAADGKFAFIELAAGEYTVSELLVEGWNVVSPEEGKAIVNITDASVTDLVFVNQLVPVVAAVPEVVAPVVAENATALTNDTIPSNATAAINTTA
ncbi:MAG: carboxypeptidase-like regulatory domain-containing protein [Methanothrix sp.]|nr:carboxypeptidase-like regulatory domain-containing protein [Methanothrix sp.]MDD4446635.1 carboxypeptidase-like regulatory domain-containing protein [Methanothrix sp.]